MSTPPPPPKAIFLAPVVNAKGVTLAEQIDAVVTYNTEALNREQPDTAQRVANHDVLHAADIAALNARIVEVEARGKLAHDDLCVEIQKAHTLIKALEAHWFVRLARWVKGIF